MRPVSGVIGLALEVFQPLEVGCVGRRQGPYTGDEVPGRDSLAAFEANQPAGGFFVVMGGADTRVELDIATQREAVRHVVQVTQDGRLIRIALGPGPFPSQLLGEAVVVVDAFDIALGAGIAIPEPHATHIFTCLVDTGRQAGLTQPMEHVHAGEAGANDHGIEFLHLNHLVTCWRFPAAHQVGSRNKNRC
ncbi:hypothetical protein D9M71_241560 [compost metagenome]